MRDKTYVKTYFRVECGYVWGKGIDKGPLHAFYNEVKELLGEIGFTVYREAGQEMLGACLEMARGKEKLYCHPMSLSGPVLVAQIEPIKAQLVKAKHFRFRMVDTYETGIDYTREELEQVLASGMNELRYMIYLAFCTPRVNQYLNELAAHDTLHMSCGVGERFGQQVVMAFEGSEHRRMVAAAVNTMFQSMINDGYLVVLEQENKKFYRSRNKGELHKLRMAVPASNQPGCQGLLSMVMA